MGEGNGPSYISAHSADVILSDIRPIKLKPEGLRAINVLLDEFLAKILSTSSSLSTDKLRAGLLSLLPTSLGKEALLEAEVELRAYWERTDPKAVPEDDSRTFHLQWAFSLLRVKCEAYSTLNEGDEDPDAESRVNQMFDKADAQPPKSSLIDPAALYLTAILESMCEHILSNVGRVAARDSSRTYATVNDIFIALCEDDSIYGLFRTMKVYEQIEQMSKTAESSRRSKSISRHERYSTSRTSSPQLELTQTQSSSSQPRQSFDGQAPAPASAAPSRTSFDKAKAMRMFHNGRSNSEVDAQSNHKKSESLRSTGSRAYTEDEPLSPEEDAAMLREFDDLMRSASTMKVSLTPDRLKTMEVYKQEKDAKNISARRGLHVTTSQPNPPPASRPGLQKPLLRQVDSINEDEEDSNSPKARTRQVSVTTPPPSANFVPASATRSRSISTSSAIRSDSLTKRPARSPSVSSPPTSFTPSKASDDMSHAREFRKFNVHDNSGFPARTRVKQRNRDSLDLDDVMNGSDDEEEETPVHQHQKPKHHQQPPMTPKKAGGVSSQTRDLMDFLAEGPPELPQGRGGNDFADILASGPPDSDAKPKGTGRLQRMISKLNLGNEKVKAAQDAKAAPPKPPLPPAVLPTPPRLPNMQSMSSLANRPIPPRPPRPISPPSSPSMSHESSDENRSFRNAPRRPYQDTSLSREASFSTSERAVAEKPTAYPISPVSSAGPARREPSERHIPIDSPTLSGNTYTPTSSVSGHGYSTPTGSGYATPNNNGYGHSGHVNPGGAPQPQQNGRGYYNPQPHANGRDRPLKDVLNDSQTIVPVRTTSFPSPSRKPVPSIASSRASPAPSPPPSFAYAPQPTSHAPPVHHGRPAQQHVQVAQPPKPAKSVARMQSPTPAPEPAAAPVISESDIRDMQRLLANASTADECRLIFDMYLARNKIPREPKVPYPSPSPSVVKANTHMERSLETSVVELFLGGSRQPHQQQQQQQRVTTNTEPAPIEGLPSSALAPSDQPSQYDGDIFTPSTAPSRHMAPISA